jgi:23S rRNA (cytosine1962-C5)-methyltransferase
MAMSLPIIYLNSHEDDRILKGHLWSFSNEIERKEGDPKPGDLVDLYSHRKKFLGRGFYNPHSLIAFRMLSRQEELIDTEFFARRIAAAHRLRSRLYPDEKSYRLVFGEADFMPGLIIDRFEDTLVLQSHTLGMDRLLSHVVKGLKKVIETDCIIKKNDSALRALEGLPEEVEVLEGKPPVSLKISQKMGAQTLRFVVDPLHGQKTGFFFDQRENRERIAAYCAGKRVLDGYANSGGFGLYAAKSGAKDVTAVESSAAACALIEQNFKANGAEGTVLQEDVEEAFGRFREQHRKFDVVVIDPPALAKSKKDLHAALRKYKKINALALSLLDRDGILITCSCSHHVSRNEFVKMVNEAAIDAERDIRVLELRGASRDHPVLPGMPETEYLKCAVVKAD